MTDNKRFNFRIDLNDFRLEQGNRHAQLFDADGEEIGFAKVENIGESGISISSECKLNIDDVLNLDFSFDSNVYRLSGKVIWIRPEHFKYFFGVEFIHKSDAFEQVLYLLDELILGKIDKNTE